MNSADDPFDLTRFVVAQAPVYDTVVEELRGGRKRSHWMWFVFPQLRGLGGSPTAVHYGISSLQEARAYLEHELLGPRLHECTGLVNRTLSKQYNYGLSGQVAWLVGRHHITAGAAWDRNDLAFQQETQFGQLRQISDP